MGAKVRNFSSNTFPSGSKKINVCTHLHPQPTSHTIIDSLGAWVDGKRGGAEHLLDHVNASIEIGPRAVHLVDEAHPGNPILVRLRQTVWRGSISCRLLSIPSAAKIICLLGEKEGDGSK